jgi:hypothetical protein
MQKSKDMWDLKLTTSIEKSTCRNTIKRRFEILTFNELDH